MSVFVHTFRLNAALATYYPSRRRMHWFEHDCVLQNSIRGVQNALTVAGLKKNQ